MRKYWIIGVVVLGAVGLFCLKMWTDDRQPTDLRAEVRSCHLPNTTPGEMDVPADGTLFQGVELHGRVRAVRFERCETGVRVSFQTHAGRWHEVETPPLIEWGNGGDHGNGTGVSVHFSPCKDGMMRELTTCKLVHHKASAPDTKKDSMLLAFEGDVKALLFSHLKEFVIVIINTTDGKRHSALFGKTGLGSILEVQLLP